MLYSYGVAWSAVIENLQEYIVCDLGTTALDERTADDSYPTIRKIAYYSTRIVAVSVAGAERSFSTFRSLNCFKIDKAELPLIKLHSSKRSRLRAFIYYICLISYNMILRDNDIKILY